MANPNPIRPTDDEARALAKRLLATATFAALGTIDPTTSAPMVTRIALATTPDRLPVSLISDLSLHAGALKSNPACSLLVGEPGNKGDPLTHPRLTLQCTARAIQKREPGYAQLSQHYLSCRPKAALYAGFADFYFVVFDITSGFLNGGFGKAFRLTPNDLIG